MSGSMNRRPIILSLTKMHVDGLALLRAESELQMASALDPAMLQREIVGADGLIIRTGGVVDPALLEKGASSESSDGMASATIKSTSTRRLPVAFKSSTPQAPIHRAWRSTFSRS